MMQRCVNIGPESGNDLLLVAAGMIVIDRQSVASSRS
jgi:hypothetical protein